MNEEIIPFATPDITDAERRAVDRVLRSGWLTTGDEVDKFENEFAAMLGCSPEMVVSVNSATAALHLALDASGIGPGDEVIVPTWTFTATAEVVSYMGAKPVFVDVDPHTLNISPVEVERNITTATKAIIPVHFAGLPVNSRSMQELADQHGLVIIEDAAHALPATDEEGHMVGDVKAKSGGCAFSFYANKTMTTGEGGALVMPVELARRARVMRLHGIDRDVSRRYRDVKASWVYDVVDAGYKYNLTDIAAAIGRVQLRRLPSMQARRQQISEYYADVLSDVPATLPARPIGMQRHSWHLFVLRVDRHDRDEVILRLRQRGVGSSVHFIPLHKMSAWRQHVADRPFPVADENFHRVVSIPLFSAMSDNQVERVATAVKEVLSR